MILDTDVDILIVIGGLLRGALIILIGPLNTQIGYLLLVMLVDYCLGVSVARKNKKFDPVYARKKTIEKVLIYSAWIVIFNAFDMVAKLPGTTRWLCILALLGIEMSSSMRSTGKLGHKELFYKLSEVYYFAMKKIVHPQGGKKDDE